MREIKIKAWDTLNKKWTLPLVASSGAVTFVEPYAYRKDTKGNLINIVVVQYTGLKDKNENEIWEGDIVNFPLVNYDSGKEIMGIWEIKWINDEALFGMREKGGEELIMDINLQHLEVIGNIYENPKLLKDKT